MKKATKTKQIPWGIIDLVLLEFFLLYLFIRSKDVYDTNFYNTNLEQFSETASILVNEDKVGAMIWLKEAIHGTDGITYRYIVKTDCPHWDYETRYVTDTPIEWIDETSAVEVIIYDTQIRYNGTVYASGQYFTIPILGGISSELISHESWEENLVIQAYQAYTATAIRNNRMQRCIGYVMLIGVVVIIYLILNNKKTKEAA